MQIYPRTYKGGRSRIWTYDCLTGILTASGNCACLGGRIWEKLWLKISSVEHRTNRERIWFFPSSRSCGQGMKHGFKSWKPVPFIIFFLGKKVPTRCARQIIEQIQLLCGSTFKRKLLTCVFFHFQIQSMCSFFKKEQSSSYSQSQPTPEPKSSVVQTALW